MKVSALHLAVTVAVAASIQQLSCQTVNPGFRVIITSKALNYAYEVGLPLLKEWLCDYAIPTISVSGKIGLASVKYSFSNISIHSLDFGNSSLTSDERGLVITAEDILLSFSADFLVHELDWPYFIDSGSGNFTIRNTSFEFIVGLVVNESDPETGSFVLNLTSCSFHVDSIRAVFSGGASYIYNLFGPALNDIMKYELHRKTCRKLTNFINSSINDNYINSIPTVFKVGDVVEIDYGLVANATFPTEEIIITDHKGEFMLQKSPSDPPFNASPLPNPSEKMFNSSKMIHIIISKYVAETASYAFFEAGELAYNISSDKLWILKETTLWCASELLPKTLCQKYPKAKVMVGVRVTDYPKMQVTSSYAALKVNASITMYVTSPNGSQEVAFTLDLCAEGHVEPYFKSKEKRVCAKISHGRITNMTVMVTHIGNLNKTKLCDIIEGVLIPLGVSYVNSKYTQPGFPIPTEDGFTFTNSVLSLGEGYVVVSTDISYRPTFLQRNMTCVYPQL